MKMCERSKMGFYLVRLAHTKRQVQIHPSIRPRARRNVGEDREADSFRASRFFRPSLCVHASAIAYVRLYAHRMRMWCLRYVSGSSIISWAAAAMANGNILCNMCVRYAKNIIIL